MKTVWSDYNIFIHCLIVFLILSLFFLWFESHLVSHQFQECLNHNLQDQSKRYIEGLYKDKILKKPIDPQEEKHLDMLYAIYNEPDMTSEIQNGSLCVVLVAICVSILGLLLLFKLISNSNNTHCQDDWKTSWTDFMQYSVMFILLALFQLFFFVHVMSQFSPISPSTFYFHTLNRTRNNLIPPIFS